MLIRTAARLAVVGFLAACGGGDGGGGVGPVTDPPVISSVSPDTIVEGGSAVIAGQNFSPLADSNLVRIDGRQAVVTSASTTQLTVQVPSTCGATRLGAVTVTVSNRLSNAVAHPIKSNPQTVTLEVGKQAIFRGSGAYCLRLPENAQASEYLLGIQSIDANDDFETDVSVSGSQDTGAAAAPPSAAPTPAQAQGQVSRGSFDLAQMQDDPDFGRYLQHRRAHSALLARNIEAVRSVGGPRGSFSAAHRAPGPERVVVTGNENVGDRVDFKFRRLGEGCGPDDTANVTAELKIKTDNTMWFVDVANPSPGFSDVQLQALADLYENTVLATDVTTFGDPGDIDENGRVGILITKEVNEGNPEEGAQTIGFVNPCDWLDRQAQIDATNEGEFFYAIAPDEGGVFGQEVSIEFLEGFMPFVLAHELAHIIQFSRRFENPLANDLMTVWEMEGQATLAEEVVGHAVLGNQPGQNYGGVLAFDTEDALPLAWYRNGFTDLAFYYGADPENQTKVIGAPDECTWTDLGDDDPCLSRALWYGVTWSFLRWASDQFGDSFGGEANFHKAIIDGRRSGFENLGDVLGAHGAIEDMLAQWSATLYVDDRVEGLDPRLTMSSWNLFDVEDVLLEFARLTPRARTFGGFSDDTTIRSPSMAYWLISGAPNTSLSLNIAANGGSALPDHLQAWVVRTQ